MGDCSFTRVKRGGLTKGCYTNCEQDSSAAAVDPSSPALHRIIKVGKDLQEHQVQPSTHHRYFSSLTEGCSRAAQLSATAHPPVQLLVSSSPSSANPTPPGLRIGCHALSTTLTGTIPTSISVSARLRAARKEIHRHSLLRSCNGQTRSIRPHAPTDKLPAKHKKVL